MKSYVILILFKYLMGKEIDNKLYSLAEEFIRLSFVADKLLGEGNVIDAYYGNPEIKNNLPELSVENLLYRFEDLRKYIEQEVEDKQGYYRKTMLLKQIQALTTYISLEKGLTHMDYQNAVKNILDIEISIVPEYCRIDEIINEIRELFAKSDITGFSMQEMYNNWWSKNEITAEEFLNNVKMLAPIFQERTNCDIISKCFPKIDLYTFEKKSHIDFSLVDTNQGWSGYNYYCGNYTSKVVFNSKVKRNRLTANSLIAHEAYPGHHTSGMIKEYLYLNGELGLEASIHLLNTPECTILEGIGESAYKLISSNLYNGDYDDQIVIKSGELKMLTTDAAIIKLHIEGEKDDSVRDFLITKGLMNKDNANQLIKFLKTWKYYVPAYRYGHDIVMNAYKKLGKNSFKYLYGYHCPTTIKNHTGV